MRVGTIQVDRVRVLHPALTVEVHGKAQAVDADAARISEILVGHDGDFAELTEFAEITVPHWPVH